MKKENIHPIYFQSFVAKWKLVNQEQVKPEDWIMTYFRNCKYTETTQHRGTVNGDVDEVSVNGDRRTDDFSKTGTIKLTMEGQKYHWDFVLKKNPDVKTKPRLKPEFRPFNELTLQNEHTTLHYVYNGPAFERRGYRKPKPILAS